MAGTTFATGGVTYASGQPYYDNILTNFFLQLLPDARNESSVLLGMIEKTGKTPVSGRYLVWPVLYGRNTGVGSVGYQGAIPDPGYRNSATCTALSRVGMATIQLDGDTIRHGKTNGGAYAEAVKLEMEGVIKDIMIDRARQVHNDGSGRVAEVGTTIGANSCNVVVNSSIEGASTTNPAGTLDQYFEIGERVAFISNTGTIRAVYSSQQGAYVQAISVSGSVVTITFTDTPGKATSTNFNSNPASGEWIVRCSQDASTTTTTDSAFKREIMGIGGIYSDIGVLNGMVAAGAQQSAGTYDDTSTATTWFQGVVCSTNPWDQGIVLDSSGAGNRPLTEALMQQAVSDAERINNANITMLMSSYPTYDSYVALLTPDKRYQNTTDLKGGHTTLSFNGLPYVKDRFCYQNRIYFLGLDQLQMAETAPLQSLTAEDVTVWNRATNSSGKALDRYWRGWVWDDELIVSGVRNRTGAVLVNLSA